MLNYLLLDIGGVVIDIYPERVPLNLQKYVSREIPGIEEWFFSADFKRDLDSGRIGKTEFHRKVCERADIDISFDDFARIYRDYWTLKAPVVEWLRRQKEEFGLTVFYLSNTCPFHVPYIFDELPALDFADGWVGSWQLKVMKPDTDFFLRAREKLGFVPEESVFFDDSEQNVEAADACGIRAFTFTGLEKMKEELYRCMEKR